MFQTVFIADPAKVQLWAPISFAATAVAAYIGIRWTSQRAAFGPIGRVQLWGLRLTLVVGIIGAAAATLLVWSEYSLCATNVESKDVSVTIGLVTDLIPRPRTGHAAERFTVGNDIFSFNGTGESCSFDQAAMFGGPIHEGLVVRVFHKRGRILRLDIAK